MTALTQQVLVAAIVALAGAYLARQAWRSWRAWHAAGDERGTGCGTDCHCG